MRNPVQTDCGHLFCRGCLEPVLEGPNPVCPADKTSISKDTVHVSVGLCSMYSNCTFIHALYVWIYTSFSIFVCMYVLVGFMFLRKRMILSRNWVYFNTYLLVIDIFLRVYMIMHKRTFSYEFSQSCMDALKNTSQLHCTQLMHSIKFLYIICYCYSWGTRPSHVFGS